MSDVKTLRLASAPISKASLEAFLTYQRALIAGLAGASGEGHASWAGRFAFAHARALQASGLDAMTQQRLKAAVSEYAGRRSAWLTVRQRVADAVTAVEGARAAGRPPPAKAQALLERAEQELRRLEDFTAFAQRYGDEALTLLREHELELVTLHRELSRLEGTGHLHA